MRKLIVAAAALLAACSGGDDDPCGEPGYGGAATDEAWRTMVDGDSTAKVGDPDAVTITQPTEGQSMSAGSGPPTIIWTSPIAKRPHLPPVTGDIYFVKISVPGRACPVQMLTTDEAWQLSAADWDVLKAGAGTMSVQITSAYLTENRITEGPYRPSAPRTFTVGP